MPRMHAGKLQRPSTPTWASLRPSTVRSIIKSPIRVCGRFFTSNAPIRNELSEGRRGQVVVALSGGVDSALSAYLLQQQGYEVVGLHMRNWSEAEEGFCSGNDDLDVVDQVCKHLKIDYKVTEFSKEYWNHVFEPALEDYSHGRTPNPDVLCNREIKFKRMLDFAFSVYKSADYVATGHYARLRPSKEHPGSVELLQGKDGNKDQSYFLMQVPQTGLRRVLFPLGEYIKPDVKKLAAEVGLPNAHRKESMGLCFVGKRKFGSFLNQYIDGVPGKFVSLDTNEVLGTHNGLCYYTIGQATNLSGQKTRQFVAEKDLETNTIYVCNGQDHPSLFVTSFGAKSINWIAGELPKELQAGQSLSCTVKTRYRQESIEATIERIPQLQGLDSAVSEPNFQISLALPTRAVTPGQYVAIYRGEVCLGGGVIASLGQTFFRLGKTLPSRVIQ